MPRKKKGLLRKKALQDQCVPCFVGAGVQKRRRESTKKHKRSNLSGKKKRCFLCGSADHDRTTCNASSLQRAEFRKREKARKQICFVCREPGHSFRECPNNVREDKGTTCYNCGAFGHQLKDCPKPKRSGGLRFAQCFVCGKTGHIAKQCPKNERGLYPNGGGCLHCGSVRHLVSECPNRITKDSLVGDYGDEHRLGDYASDGPDEKRAEKKVNIVKF